MQLLRQTAALDGGAQHVLASARVLVRHPPSMDQHSTEVIHEQEEIGTFAAGDTGERHERTDEDVAHPAFVGTFSFVSAEGTRLTCQRRAVETATVQMLADGALRNRNAMPCFQDRADLSCGATA